MKKIIAMLVLCTLSTPGVAQWVAGGGYINLSEDDLDVSVGGVYGSIAYQIEAEGNFMFLPELRIGVGVGDDTVDGITVELSTFLALSLRGQYEFDSGLYLYAAPSYAQAEFDFSGFFGSGSEDESEVGIGGGAGYKFSDNAWGELSYEVFDGIDAVSFGFKYAF
ncbi:MAG: outer membrane beta-barrel protein [Pseudomonadota bacterium]